MKKTRLLQDEYPTRYLPRVGRQVMQDGGTPDQMWPRPQEEQNVAVNDLATYAQEIDTRQKMSDVGTAMGQTWPDKFFRLGLWFWQKTQFMRPKIASNTIGAGLLSTALLCYCQIKAHRCQSHVNDGMGDAPEPS